VRPAARQDTLTLTSSSWLNLVERFFADMTEDVIRLGSFASVNELVRDINAYLADRNAAPSPTHGRPKAPRSLPRSSAPAPHSTPPQPLCEDFCESGY
jgi:hypothetical protein